MRIKLLIPAILFIVFTSCDKQPDTSTNAPTSSDTVYIVGTEESLNGKYVARYWKNGTPISLTDSTKSAEATDIFVTKNNDVYVCGYETSATNSSMDLPKYWKNGVVVNLPLNSGFQFGTTSDIFIEGNDVYVTGSEYLGNSNTIAKYWKNGTAVNLTTNIGSAFASSVAISGTDVYVCGSKKNANGISVATYWKNGTTVSLTDGTKNAHAYNIIISGNDIHICVAEENSITNEYIVKYWKNGIVTTLLPNIKGNGDTFFNMFVSKTGDVLICGSVL